MAVGCATVRRARARSSVPRPSVDAPSAQAGHQDRDTAWGGETRSLSRALAVLGAPTQWRSVFDSVNGH